MSPKVQILARPTKPLHLLLACEGGFTASLVDTDTNAVDSSFDNVSISELDIKFRSVVVRERFAGRVRAMMFGLDPPAGPGVSRATNAARLAIVQQKRERVHVWTTTFNAANKPVDSFEQHLDKWLPSHKEMRRQRFDVFCFALQESRRFPKWVLVLLKYLNGAGGDDDRGATAHDARGALVYQLLCTHSVGAIHLLIFIRQALAHEVSQVRLVGAWGVGGLGGSGVRWC